MPATLQAPAPSLHAVQPRQGDPFPDAEFVNRPNVPVFAQHETTAKDGRVLKFGYAELAAVADRCNRRIQETGDYAALSLGHNPEPQAKMMGAQPPRTVGWAGPFRMGVINGLDGTQKYAILADLHYFKDDWEQAKKYGRRSAELWVEDRYEDMFLDPIALLGAETPRLDLGLVYSRMHEGRMVEKYAATVPGAMSVHVMRQKDYAMDNPGGNTGSYDPDMIKAIVDAISQLPEWQYLTSMMAQGEAEGKDAMLGGSPDPTDTVGDGMPSDRTELPGGLPQSSTPPVPPAAGPPSAEPVAAASPMPEPPMDAPGGDPGMDAPGGDPPQETNPEKENEMAFQKACYAALDAMSDDELQQYMAGRGKMSYQADDDGEVEGEKDEVDAAAGTYSQSPAEAEGVSAEPEKTVTEQGSDKPKMTVTAYGKDGQSLKYQLDRVSTRLAKIEGELADEHKRRIDAERQARLMHYHHEGFLPDVEGAMDKLCYAKCQSDEQFDSMLELLLSNSPKIPMRRSLPNVDGAERYERTRPGFKEESSEKYSKEDQEHAMQAVKSRLKKAAKDPTADTTGWYDEELEKARSHRLNGSAA